MLSDRNIFSQCSNINKQGIYLQGNYQGIVKDYFRLIRAQLFILALIKFVTFLGHSVL